MNPIELVALKMAIDDFNNERATHNARREAHHAELANGNPSPDRRDVLNYESGYASGYASAMHHAMRVIDDIRTAGTHP